MWTFLPSFARGDCQESKITFEQSHMLHLWNIDLYYRCPHKLHKTCVTKGKCHILTLQPQPIDLTHLDCLDFSFAKFPLQNLYQTHPILPTFWENYVRIFKNNTQYIITIIIISSIIIIIIIIYIYIRTYHALFQYPLLCRAPVLHSTRLHWLLCPWCPRRRARPAPAHWGRRTSSAWIEWWMEQNDGW